MVGVSAEKVGGFGGGFSRLADSERLKAGGRKTTFMIIVVDGRGCGDRIVTDRQGCVTGLLGLRGWRVRVRDRLLRSGGGLGSTHGRLESFHESGFLLQFLLPSFDLLPFFLQFALQLWTLVGVLRELLIRSTHPVVKCPILLLFKLRATHKGIRILDRLRLSWVDVRACTRLRLSRHINSRSSLSVRRIVWQLCVQW